MTASIGAATSPPNEKAPLVDDVDSRINISPTAEYEEPIDNPRGINWIIRLFTGPPICPPGIDPSPKFRPNGDRIFLRDQRGPTKSQLLWTILAFPTMEAWRRRNLPTDPIELLRRGAELPDPTVFVPTVDIGVECSSTFDEELVAKRIQELEIRKDKLEEENRIWAETAPRSRKARLALIDRGIKWDPEGRRLFLFMQREPTRWETVMTIITLPWMIYRAGRGFYRHFKRMKESGEETTDFADMEDFTVVIPTGKSLWLMEELRDVKPHTS